MTLTKGQQCPIGCAEARELLRHDNFNACLAEETLRRRGPGTLYMKQFCLALLVLFTATSFSANQKTAKGADLLIQLEANFAADVAKDGHAAFITHFAEDGVEVVDGGGFDTKDAMRKQAPWPEGTSLTWAPIKADMAASGDLGYTYGNFVLTSKNKDGRLVTSYGKYTSIWKKQPDGQWKVVVDVGNSSPDPKAGK